MAPSNVRIDKRAGPVCASGAPTWWNNAQGATPCDVYQSVLDRCSYTAPTLTNKDAYYPVLQAQECTCNTVAYNLGSACQDCQRGSTDQGILWSDYIIGGDGCLNPTNTLPDSATPVDEIPEWAFLDTSQQFWTYASAQQIASNNTATATSSSTATESGVPQTNSMSATPTLTPTGTPTPSSTPAPASSGHKSTNAGAIGGGVGGGVAALLVLAVLFLFCRRRRARKSHQVAGMAADVETRNHSASSESSLTESGKAVGVASHYTPHSQMAQLHHQGGSGLLVGSYSSASALTTPVDAPPIPGLPREYATPTPARSLATSPAPSSAVTNKVKRVPVRYSEDELAQAEQAEQEARRAAATPVQH